MKTIKLDTPIEREGQIIDEVVLRKPTPGELRGLSNTKILEQDVATLITLLPRITTPTLTAGEVSDMDAADFTMLGLEVATFLVSKSLVSKYQTA